MTRRGRDARRDRGQSTIDYGIGAVIFVLTVAFVLAFTPTLLQPFVGGAQDDYATADRVADQLSTDILGEPSDPYVLNTTCTDEFLKGNFTADATSICRYSGGDRHEALGLDDRTNVYVELVGEGDLGDEPGVGGPTVASASRQVLYDGAQHRLVVKVW
jgi:hypothetical protein